MPFLPPNQQRQSTEGIIVIATAEIVVLAVVVQMHSLQCFDAVGWVAGRASGL